MKREKSEMGDRNGLLLLGGQEIDAGRAHKNQRQVLSAEIMLTGSRWDEQKRDKSNNNRTWAGPGRAGCAAVVSLIFME